jgi:uncharacterized protein YjbJ (UPF0337 family)
MLKIWKSSLRNRSASPSVQTSRLRAGVGTGELTARWNRKKEDTMDWNRVEGNWKQLKGKVKEQWGRLTDDDLDVINGNRDQLEGLIQERYGYAKDQARTEIDNWYNTQQW